METKKFAHFRSERLLRLTLEQWYPQNKSLPILIVHTHDQCLLVWP